MPPGWPSASTRPGWRSPAGYEGARLLFLHEARYLVVEYGEFVELCLAVAFVSFGWCTLRRLRGAEGSPLDW